MRVLRGGFYLVSPGAADELGSASVHAPTWPNTAAMSGTFMAPRASSGAGICEHGGWGESMGEPPAGDDSRGGDGGGREMPERERVELPEIVSTGGVSE